MNYITHLRCFFFRVARDKQLNPSHISLYMALLQQWNQQRFRNPVSVAREEVMALSKIHSRVTYHKCIRELHQWRYLHYDPSYNHFRGSLVYMQALDSRSEAIQQARMPLTNFCAGAEQELNRDCTGTGQELSHSINNRNELKSSNGVDVEARAHAGSTANEQERGKCERKEKGCAEKEKKTPPEVEEVQAFFEEAGQSGEALRFFHHYSATGWRRGQALIVDWQAAASKWMLLTNLPGRERVPAKVRDYHEPL